MTIKTSYLLVTVKVQGSDVLCKEYTAANQVELQTMISRMERQVSFMILFSHSKRIEMARLEGGI